MLVLIDNYDSFTFNLVHYFRRLGETVNVYRNDALTTHDIEQLAPQYLVISPGPCSPNEAGISLEVIAKFAGRIPILGVCLGHQAIGQLFGAAVIRAPEILHGKTSILHHNHTGIFKNLPSSFNVMRYHSLCLDEQRWPEDLEVTAWTDMPEQEQRIVMGIKHHSLPVEGIQFHPESILSEYGLTLLQQFLELYKNY